MAPPVKPRKRGASVSVFKPQTVEQELGVAPKTTAAPNQAPYKPGRAPAQVETKRINRQRAASPVPQNPVDPRVVQIQTHLKQLGYNIDVDGVMGPRTRAAMQVSQNGSQPNLVHHPDHAKTAALHAVAHAEAAKVVKGSRTRFEPFYPGQKPHHYLTQLTPRRDLKKIPVYRLDAAGPEGDEGTQQNAEERARTQREAIRNQGGLFPYIAKTGLESLVPARSAHAIANGQRPTLGDIGSDVLNGALWLTPGTVAPALRTARVVTQALREEGVTATALRTIREARGTARSAAEDARALKRAQAVAKTEQRMLPPITSAAKSQLAAALDAAPNITKKQAKAVLEVNDIAARAVAHELGTTPDHAYELIWKGAQFHDIVPTVDEIKPGVLFQVGREPEVTNLSQVPEASVPSPEPLRRAARNLTRTHKDATPPHANTPMRLNALLTDLQRRAIEAADFKEWYANSAAGILSHVNSDVGLADKLAALVAVYSPRAEVYSKTSEWNNLDRAINAFDEFHETGTISPRWSISSHKEGAADWQTFRAQQIMEGNFEWQGLKTNRFYRNFLQHIDPEKYARLFGEEKFGTMDTWMRRAFGYPAVQKTEERETLFGLEQIPVGKKAEPISPQMYTFMERATQAVADSLGWAPEEAQAAIWTSIKAEEEGTLLANAGFDFRDAFLHREARRARPVGPEQLELAPTTADKPSRTAVDEAIEASRAPDSGFTLTAGLNPDTGRTGYAVAYGAYEYREAAPLTREGLLDFRNKHLALLKSDPELRVGGWHNPDDGQVYLDISRVFDSQEEAMQFAREQGQVAIFDRESFDVIQTGLAPEEADAIKAGLVEQGRLAEQVSRYDDMLARAHEQLSGKAPKDLTKAARDDAEHYLFDWVEANPDAPEARMFLDLYHDATLARNAPDAELLFQDDAIVQSIAQAHGKDIDRARILDAHAGNDLKGLPEGRRSNREAQKLAEGYMRDRGVEYHPPTSYSHVGPGAPWAEERAQRIAKWYDEAVSSPEDPEVRAAYQAMADETLAQYNAITRQGYVFEFYPAGVDPYPSGPSAAIDDLRANRHLYVFPTDEGFGTLSEAETAHPLLAPSGVTWGDRPTTHNDIFRAVHDFFGHYKEGVGFRADGEENAWRAHVAMYSPEARRAMTAETRGQNSWVNYGPHGEANKTAKQGETVYADQKAVLAPDWVVREGSGAPTAAGAVQRMAESEGGGSRLYLFRNADVSTAIHELGHAIERFLPLETRRELFDAGLDHPETFARTFEAYFATGGVPEPKLRKTMRTVAEAMAARYMEAARIPRARLNPEIKTMFDRFFLREAKADRTWAMSKAAEWFAQEQSDPMLEAAAMQMDATGMSVEDAAKMFRVDVDALRAHVESGHAAEQERILSNADVGGGPAETTESADDIIARMENELDNTKMTDSRGYTSPQIDKEISDIINEGAAREDAAERWAEKTPPPEWFLQEGEGLTPEEQLQEGMSGARAARGRQEVGYSAERAKRAGNAELAMMREKGFEGYIAALDELRGELPKIDFQGFKELNAESLDHLFTTIQDHPHLTPFAKIRAQRALLRAVEGRVPTKSEITDLENIFGKDTARGLQDISTMPAHLQNLLLEVLNVPRSLMASFDVSAPFRQGLVVSTRHPVIFFRNFKTMFKVLGSERAYQAVMDDIITRPTFGMMQRARLAITDMGALETREEQFYSNLAETITGGKRSPVRASGRAYTGFLVKTRADVFDHLLRVAQAQGIDVTKKSFLESLGRYINSATGRGSLGAPDGGLERAATVLNTVFFSPRLLASRINFLNPVWYARLDPFARKQALRSALQLAAAAGVVANLARLGGARVTGDPRSADFAKLRFGDTRLDILGGFQQPIRLVSQLYSGTIISSTTGDPLSLGPQGPGATSRRDILLRFFEGKLAPSPSVVNDWFKGTDFQGEPFSWKKEAYTHLLPLLSQDITDLYREGEGGINGIALAMAGYTIGAFGVGMQTYKERDPAAKPTKKLQEAADKVGMPEPNHAILLALDHKAHLDQITRRHPKDPQAVLKAAVEYYRETTKRNDFDPVLRAAKGNDPLARQMIDQIRTVMVGEGLSAYEGAVRTISKAKGIDAELP